MADPAHIENNPDLAGPPHTESHSVKSTGLASETTDSSVPRLASAETDTNDHSKAGKNHSKPPATSQQLRKHSFYKPRTSLGADDDDRIVQRAKSSLHP